MEMLFPIIDASDCSCLSWKQKENYCIEGKCTPACCLLLRYSWTAGGTTETLAFVKITKNGKTNDVKLENVQ